MSAWAGEEGAGGGGGVAESQYMSIFNNMKYSEILRDTSSKLPEKTFLI